MTIVKDATEHRHLKVNERVHVAGWSEDDNLDLSRIEAHGVVTAISDPDADYDDDLGRAVSFNPKVSVTFDDGTQEDFTTFAKYPFVPYYDEPDFICEDIEVVS